MTSSDLKFSANLGFLWTDRSLPDAIHAAAAAGFDAVECHWPYDIDPNEVSLALRKTGLPMVGINTHFGDVGMFGLSALPHYKDKARHAIMKALDYAEATSASCVHVMAGCAEGDDALEVFLENLAIACSEAATRNITILIEPINTKDVPGYFLNTADQAIDIINMINHPSLKLMFDCYHIAIMKNDVISLLEAYMSIIGHIQFAGVPDRGRPDIGVLDYNHVFNVIQDLGWLGYLGAEYKPGTDHGRDSTDLSLGWMKVLR